MRPYGLEHTLIAGPDVADIQEQARKSSVGYFAGKGGEHRSHVRSASKRTTRVSIKRGARRAGRAEIACALRDVG
jgi:hypothetical protein